MAGVNLLQLRQTYQKTTSQASGEEPKGKGRGKGRGRARPPLGAFSYLARPHRTEEGNAGGAGGGLEMDCPHSLDASVASQDVHHQALGDEAPRVPAHLPCISLASLLLSEVTPWRSRPRT